MKVMVLDTSVLMHDPMSPVSFKEHEVVIPIIVLEELDGLKSHPSKGERAREVLRELRSARESGNFQTGIQTPGGGLLRVDLDGDDTTPLPKGFDREKGDNLIILTAKRLKEARPKEEVVLVTKDINMAVKADSLGIKTEDYKSDKVKDADTEYAGTIEVEVEDEVIHLIHTSSKKGILALDNIRDKVFGNPDLYPNHCCKLTGKIQKKTALAIFKKVNDGEFHLVSKPCHDKGGIHPRNDEQVFAFQLAMDGGILISTITGNAGTGKSLMSLLAGWRMLNNKGDFCTGRVAIDAPFKPERMMVFRPTHEIGKEMGFLPGTIEEKFAPWQRPALSNLRLIAGEDGGGEKLEEFLKDGKIEILPINHIRGDTIHNSLIIIDDAQNLTPHEMKAVVTRVGQGSKIIVNGDLQQVDVVFLGPNSNGLAHIIARCVPKKKDYYAHLRLVKGERSKVAEFAAEVL